MFAIMGQRKYILYKYMYTYMYKLYQCMTLSIILIKEKIDNTRCQFSLEIAAHWKVLPLTKNIEIKYSF